MGEARVHKTNIACLFPVAQQAIGIGGIFKHVTMLVVNLFKKNSCENEIKKIDNKIEKITNKLQYKIDKALLKEGNSQLTPDQVVEMIRGKQREKVTNLKRERAKILPNVQSQKTAILANLKGIGIGLARTLPLVGTIFSSVVIAKDYKAYKQERAFPFGQMDIPEMGYAEEKLAEKQERLNLFKADPALFQDLSKKESNDAQAEFFKSCNQFEKDAKKREIQEVAKEFNSILLPEPQQTEEENEWYNDVRNIDNENYQDPYAECQVGKQGAAEIELIAVQSAAQAAQPAVEQPKENDANNNAQAQDAEKPVDGNANEQQPQRSDAEEDNLGFGVSSNF